MIRQSLKSVVRAVAPYCVADTYIHLKRMREARRMVGLRDRVGDPELWIDDLLQSYFFRPLQRRPEILRLAEIVRARRPSAICEIGAAGGGTAFVFAQAAAPNAVILSIDVSYSASRRAAVSRFALPGQKMICLEADSQSDETLRGVSDHLGARQLDFLFIDGDHSYRGVASDFHRFSPLVRPGGVIAFHDIVPVKAGDINHFGGDVPRFWRELKTCYSATEEIIGETAQSGAGIGILHWN